MLDCGDKGRQERGSAGHRYSQEKRSDGYSQLSARKDAIFTNRRWNETLGGEECKCEEGVACNPNTAVHWNLLPRLSIAIGNVGLISLLGEDFCL